MIWNDCLLATDNNSAERFSILDLGRRHCDRAVLHHRNRHSTRLFASASTSSTLVGVLAPLLVHHFRPIADSHFVNRMVLPPRTALVSKMSPSFPHFSGLLSHFNFKSKEDAVQIELTRLNWQVRATRLHTREENAESKLRRDNFIQFDVHRLVRGSLRLLSEPAVQSQWIHWK